MDILHVGRHTDQKRVDLIIRLAESMPDRKFSLVGIGPLTGELQQSARHLGNVEFVGSLPHSEVRRAMHASRLFLFPSGWEAQPIALLEAIDAGLPIVLSDIPAHRRFIDCGAAVPFRNGDLSDLRRAVAEAGRNETLDRLSRGRRQLRHKHDPTIIADQWAHYISGGSNVS